MLALVSALMLVLAKTLSLRLMICVMGKALLGEL